MVLLYVVGSGRSGSTVLDTVLGNHPDVASFGELSKLVENGWVRNEYCACGVRARECDFWSRVLEAWRRRVPDLSLKAYVQLEEKYTRHRRIAHLIVQRIFKSRDFDRYARSTVALLQSLREVAGRRILVDSSKQPARGLALELMSGVDVRFLHNVRDGRGVLRSLKKSFEKDEKAGVQRSIEPKPTWRVAAFWVVVNLLSEALRWTAGSGRSVRVRYEDLVGRPATAMADVERVINLDFGGIVSALEQGEPLEVGHTIAGNRLRMEGEIRVRADTTWRSDLSRWEQRKFWYMTGLLMRRYGYTRDFL